MVSYQKDSAHTSSCEVTSFKCLGCFSHDRLYYMVVASNPEKQQKFILCPCYLSSLISWRVITMSLFTKYIFTRGPVHKIHALRGEGVPQPGLREGAGQAEGPHRCRGGMQEVGQPGRDRRRPPGNVWPISLSPDQPDPSSKLTYQSERLPPGGQCIIATGQPVKLSAPWWSVHHSNWSTVCHLVVSARHSKRLSILSISLAYYTLIG
uniref:Uncharacterized protein n=1 Tax=Myotis myotis TaxID=51298 RepID=A0A7J7ZX67_MYOMY|nr:hypothetical protein mMyoMyo1_009624 [Myotis myotis]